MIPSPKDFFISYNQRDRPWAEWLAWTLEEAGYSVIIDAWDFRPGGNFALEMDKAAQQSHKTIAVLSDHYLQAVYTRSEWTAAFAKDPTGENRSLLTVRVSSCEPEGILGLITRVDIFGLDEGTAQLKVLEALKERAKSKQKPVFPGSAINFRRVPFPGVQAGDKLFYGKALHMSLSQCSSYMTIRLFYSYSRQDDEIRRQLEAHLSGLKRSYKDLVTWYDRMLEPGSNWDARIKAELDTADIIVLLVSSDFLHSNYCYETEVTRAIQRHKDGTACVIPVLLRPTDIDGLLLFDLIQGYPSGLLPITEWENRDRAFVDVAKGIRQAVQKRAQEHPIVPPPAQEDLRLQGFAFESVTVNENGEIVGHQPGEAQQWVEPLGDGVVLEMVSIPGGSFLMGSPRDEEGRDDSESPQHRVAIAPFLMGRYPVTQSQYQAVMESNPSDFQEDGANRPVENVDWGDAVAFCAKLFQRTKRTYRLPSEAEWEYACRAGTITPFSFGRAITTDLANYQGIDEEDVWGATYSGSYAKAPKGENRGEPTIVGSFPPNAFGLFDMHGNVWEWCADYWHPNYQGAPTDGRTWVTGSNSSDRLLRGGSWLDFPVSSRSAARLGNPFDYLLDNTSFRVCCSDLRAL